jgi:hypothetical protein
MLFSFKVVGVLVLLVLGSFIVLPAPAFPNLPFPRPSCRVAPYGPTLPWAAVHVQPRGAAQLRAPPGLPRRAGRGASAVGKVWPLAGNAGVLRGCAAKAPAQKYRLHFLSVASYRILS